MAVDLDNKINFFLHPSNAVKSMEELEIGSLKM